ncbi:MULTISPECIES: sensor histidine kinase [Clostridium]|uniref:Two-component system, sensor histidine kinase YesM n=1 Tax=Clostridium cadaveris TaxID=1529 RepID=A0A1I2KLE6_9CLOT|nr:histidine kinase [Clostridium cadaveris]MDU4953666.1 histidine kinase [Clostridium sp.]MDM8311881.1 histidine kinase [Clostridium cadaveris]MDY4949436.1 histidine kinase [Clostridium cadaveris]NWK11295.1 sensor histidine kinase [Clostridium cadaveris]SFF67333.1 two-component system, sensor histidine kinase YesM [Clostridium cadaveris]
MKNQAKGRSFFSKILFYFMLVSILPVILLGFFTKFISQQVSMNRVENQLIQATQVTESRVNNLLTTYKDKLTVFCNDAEIYSILSINNQSQEDINKIYNKMYLLLSGQTSKMEMHLFKADDSFSVSTSKLPKIYNVSHNRQWGLFRAISNSISPIVYPNRYTMDNGVEIALSIAKTIRDGDKIIGYAVIDIPEKALRDYMHAGEGSLPLAYTITDKQFYVVYNETFPMDKVNFFNADFKHSLIKNDLSTRFYNLNDQKLLVANKNSNMNNLIIMCSVPVDLILDNFNYITLTTSIIAVFSLLLCFIVSWVLARSVTKPIKNIVSVIKKVETGDMTARTDINRDDEIGDLASGLNKMIVKVDNLFKVNLEKQDRLRLAELKNLYSQINPHFLYNTLDSIKWLAKLKQFDDINTVVTKLGLLLKNNINNHIDIVTVEESMKFIESYLAIEKIRYAEKLNIDIYVDPNILYCKIPKLTIQPIVENAIIHGIENKIGAGTISIRFYQNNEDIVFEVKDDGIGMSGEKLAEIKTAIKSSETNDSIGLQNTNRRLKLYYGEKYGIKIQSKQNIGTTVILAVPMIKSEE